MLRERQLCIYLIQREEEERMGGVGDFLLYFSMILRVEFFCLDMLSGIKK